ncbi:MAG: peptide chain release factor N(5)-glutamine methyltransferase [Candidatus Riflebacteria bacterium]|nr:peptide chain release factor N(5)-glutamine methyltransferase [Candidatus Riflebacteria bacterium]
MAIEMTIRKIYSECTEKLLAAGFDEAALNAEILVAECLGLKKSEMHLNYGSPLNSSDLEKINIWLERRLRHEPLQYIVEKWPFLHLQLNVGPGVLIPRTETEYWTDLLIKSIKRFFPSEKFIFADVGTGTGAIGLSIVKQYFGSSGFLIDLSPKALNVAKTNMINNSISPEKICFTISDLLSGIKAESLDLIVSNPPYISETEIPELMPEVRDFEPQIALVGGPDGSEIIFRLINQSRVVLKSGGILAIEHSWNQQKKIVDFCIPYFKILYMGKDFEEKERFLFLEKI